MQIKAFVAKERNQDLIQETITINRPGADEVLVKVLYCGVCHSDIHLIDNDWGFTKYPLVPGHEITGIVENTGPNVTHLKAGDRVGIGWQSDACGACELCTGSYDNLCTKQKATCVGATGGFAEKIVVNSNYAFKLPEGLESSVAAPLMCAGITAFAPLKKFFENIASSKPPIPVVGIYGLGGIGHLGLQYAKAFGAKVTVFSRNQEKLEKSLSLGADDYVDINDKSALRRKAQAVDFMLITSNHGIIWSTVLNLLKHNGTACLVGIPDQEITFPGSQLLSKQLTLTGSVIGGSGLIREMLTFSECHKVFPIVEKFSVSEINSVLKVVREGKMAFRAVLKLS